MGSFSDWNHQRKLDSFIKHLSTGERSALNSYLMSGEGPLPAGTNLDGVLPYLKGLPESKWPLELMKALGWFNQRKTVTPSPAHDHRNVTFTLQSTDGIDPTMILLLSRDINDDTKLMLQEINVDSGDYIPVPVALIAEMLRDYADLMEKRQEAINQWGEH